MIARPMRFIKLLFQNPKRAIYDLAKFTYWRLPPSIRFALHTPRHKFIRWVRAKPNLIKRYRNPNNSDLDWEEFKKQVLDRSNEYKGIFIQELNIDWKVPLYQRPQHMACALGRLGYLVIYKTANLSHDDVWGVRQVAPNVWLTACPELDSIKNAVYSFYSTAFLIPPELILRRNRAKRIIYEYIDHIDLQISGDKENIRRLLKLKNFAFNGGADFIVASARRLEEEATNAIGSDKVFLIPNGVDTRHYRNPNHKTVSLPENFVQFKNKYSNIVGYFGAIAPWLWYESICELVKSRPDLGFVFIGPDYYGGASNLPVTDNCLYLGIVEYSKLPAYARQFDVCFIPFTPGEIARATSPLKLFEYFALEKPVVVTSEMLECVAFKEVFYGSCVRTLSKAINDAIAVKGHTEFKMRLAKLADENDWDERAKAMEKILLFNLH